MDLHISNCYMLLSMLSFENKMLCINFYFINIIKYNEINEKILGYSTKIFSYIVKNSL